jgi:ribonuclease Z
LKRKRSPSPFLPSKSSQLPHQPQGSSNRTSLSKSTPPTKFLAIEKLMENPSFNPRTLDGVAAQDWRAYLVQNTFRNSSPTPNERAKATRGWRKKVSTSDQGLGTSSMFMPPPKRVVHPPGFESLLPPFALPYRKITNTPETKPTVAYVVIGPRVRGKFDAEKAKELQIPNGRQRSELVKGTAITYMVPEGDGIVERTVQPEDVIGPSECPSVSVAPCFIRYHLLK